MKITIINGNPDPGNTAFEDYLDNLSHMLNSHHHTASLLELREMDIKYCNGCWGCWVKNPGKCVSVDDSDHVCREYIHSGLVLLSSPVIMGFTTALLKKATDKLIPLVHPYI